MLIKVKVNENQLTDKGNMINSWVTKLASKYKEVEKIYDPANLIQSFLLLLSINRSKPEQ